MGMIEIEEKIGGEGSGLRLRTVTLAGSRSRGVHVAAQVGCEMQQKKFVAGSRVSGST
jgi:hypothetical protein